MTITDAQGTEWLQAKLTEAEEARQRTHVQLVELQAALSNQEAQVDRLRTLFEELAPGEPRRVFWIAPSGSNLARGRFSVPKSVGQLLAQDGKVNILAETRTQTDETVDVISGRIQRYETRSGQPFINGGDQLRQYFEKVTNATRRTDEPTIRVEVVGSREVRLRADLRHHD